MRRRYVLLLTDRRLAAYRVGRATVQGEGEFSADAEGLAAFADYLAQRRSDSFLILADLAAEGFQAEKIPYGIGRDRATLVKRRLSQRFPDTSFVTAATRGRGTTGRRDEQLLLLALTRPADLSPWLAALRTAKAALAGVYSLPQVIENLPAQGAQQPMLVVTPTRAGLRLSFLTGGKLRFSRLTALATPLAADSAAATAYEAARMHPYLLGQRQIERGKPLDVQILAHPADHAVWRAHCHDSAELRFSFIDPTETAKRTEFRQSLDTLLADRHCERLFCHLLAWRPPAEQFAPPAARDYFRLKHIAFGLNACAGTLAALSLFFVVQASIELRRLQEATTQIGGQTRQDRQAYELALRTLPESPLALADLRAQVDRHEALLRRTHGPAPLLNQLSRSLDAFPHIEIERIAWDLVEQAPAQTTAAATQTQAKIDAHLPHALAGDLRAQHELVAAFIAHLSAAPDTSVRLLRPPTDAQAARPLKSGNAERTATPPGFSFLLARSL